MPPVNQSQRQWVNRFLQLHGTRPSSGTLLAQAGPSAQTATQSNSIDDLTKAIEADDLPLVQQLINSGVAVEGHDSSGMTPLTQAAKSNKPKALQIAELLINSGAKPDTAEKGDGQTPLILATYADNLPIAQLLFSKGAWVDAHDLQHRSALFVSIRERKKQIRDEILKHNPIADNAADNGWTPLMEAAAIGDLDSVKALVEKAGAMLEKSDTHGQTALAAAAQAGHEPIVEYLLKKGANPHKPKGASAQNRVPILIEAAAKGSRKVARMLLDRKVDVNERGSKNMTALMVAASKSNHAFVAELLTDPKTDATLKDQDDATALILAARAGDARSVTAILGAKQVNTDEVAKNGKTALMEAVDHGKSPDVVKAMLSGKAKPKLDLKDQDGNTALILAVTTANLQGVEALLKAGANPSITNGDGETALDVAKGFLLSSSMPEFPKIVALLQKVTPQTKSTVPPQPTSP